MEVSGKLTGLVVDQVSEVTRVADASIEPPPPVVSGVLDTAYLQGVAKLNDGSAWSSFLTSISCCPPPMPRARPRRQRRQKRAWRRRLIRAGRAAADEEQVVTFTRWRRGIRGRHCATCRRSSASPKSTPCRRRPSYIEGVISLRNGLLPIMNLRKRFRLEAGEIDREDNRIIVVNLAGAVTGVLVDAVSEVLSVSKAAIEPTPGIVGSRQAEQLRGVAKLDAGKRLIMLLDTAKVLLGRRARERLPRRSGRT